MKDSVVWNDCYDDSWKSLISPESFSHPAKYSRGLIQRIYQYCLEREYFKPGQLILDPFGGVGLGAIATHYGLNWLGNELEPRFCQMAWSWDCPGLLQSVYNEYKTDCESPQDWYKLDLGCCSECVYKAIDGGDSQLSLFDSPDCFTSPHRYIGNLERFSKYSKDGCQAVLTQGDSRKLNEVWAEGLVSSPPYARSLQPMPGNQESKAKRYARGEFKSQRPDVYSSKKNVGTGAMFNPEYGASDGQLANMPEGLVSSPPFAGNTGGKGKASREGIDPALFDRHSGGMVGGMHGTEGNLEGMQPEELDGIVSSPPYVNSLDSEQHGIRDERRYKNPNDIQQAKYGNNPDNLGSMSEGLVSSPPFASSVGSDDSQTRGGILKSDPKRKGDKNLTGEYGDSEGQLAGLVSSPPYDETVQNRAKGFKSINDPDKKIGKYQGSATYGEGLGQLGNDSGPTFWQAAQDIVSQCHSLLAPGSYCVWITKNYVKKGKEVDFTGNWQQLCISCGFEIVEEIQAMLVKNLGTQTSYSGDDYDVIIENKSFFRRLHESNVRAAKHWETLSKQEKAGLIMESYITLLESYLYELENPEPEEERDPPIRPTKNRVISGAKTMGWVRDGKIRYDIDTAIDWETVTIMRKS